MQDEGHAPQGPRRRLLEPSELGTKEYWDATYAREITNFEETEDDEGTVWFSESKAEEAVVKQLRELKERDLLNPKTARILDLGTGNGHMLFTLCETYEDNDQIIWAGDLVGVDYSEPSIRLACQIASQKLKDDPFVAGIQFEAYDILTGLPNALLQDGFDVVLDKGTFDAISLMHNPEGMPHPCELYRQHVNSFIKAKKFLFVTSCNWTKEELVDWLAPPDGGLIVYDEAKYRTFSFGGQTGQSVVTIIFQKQF